MPIDVSRLPWHAFLKRPPLPRPPESDLAFLRGEPILVTGAGGSIGSALAAHLAALQPDVLVLLEASELSLEQIEQKFAAHPRGRVISILGDAGNETLLEDIFARFNPRWIFHAAAYKHVALLEHHPLAAIRNNVLATWTLARLVSAAQSRFVLVSTDKAAAPASVMGATKRVAELIALNAGGAAIRLGNVLGSRGSVAERLADQITNSMLLTVTDLASRRYYMTVDEAANLILAAALELKQPADNGTQHEVLYAADLTATHTLQELVEFLSGQTPQTSKVSFQTIGLRPGEKHDEILWSETERPANSSRHGIRALHSVTIQASELAAAVVQLQRAVQESDTLESLRLLQKLVPDYCPSEQALSVVGAAARGACAR